MTNISLKIESISPSGDGIGKYEQKSVYVPFACSGDEITASITGDKPFTTAKIISIEKSSKERQTPPCEYFANCGGCKLQHLSDKTYDNYKQNIIKSVLRELNTPEAVLEDFYKVPQNSRRRVDLKVAIDKGDVKLGFFAPKSHDVVDIQKCIVAEDAINNFIPVLRNTIAQLKKPSVIKSVSITSLTNGLDVVINTSSTLRGTEQDTILQLADNSNVVRLSESSGDDSSGYIELNDKGSSYINFGNINVQVPTGSFLQATNDSQNQMIEFVKKYLKNAKNIADLYAGCGTFSFPLIEKAKFIGAYEGSDSMVSAIYNAIIKNKLENKMNASNRDLFKRPLKENELNNFDAVILNPPRNGALPQVKNISKSSIKKLVMVSCNPKTFSRDAKNLLDNGFKIKSLKPIDQFLYSPHMEIAAYFER